MDDMLKADYLLAQIASGKTLYVSTCLRHTKIDQRCVDRFAKAGRAILKNGDDGRLRMSVGKRYDIIDLCKLTLV